MELYKRVKACLDIQDSIKFAHEGQRTLAWLAGGIAKRAVNFAAIMAEFKSRKAYKALTNPNTGKSYANMSEWIDAWQHVPGISRNSVYRDVRVYENPVTRPYMANESVGIRNLDELDRMERDLVANHGWSKEDAAKATLKGIQFAKNHGVNEVGDWIEQTKQGNVSELDKAEKAVTDLIQKVKRLKKRLAEAESELADARKHRDDLRK